MIKLVITSLLIATPMAAADPARPAAKPAAKVAAKPVQSSPLEQNKALIRRFYEEVWNRGHLDVANEVFAKDYVRHDPGGGAGTPPGPEGQKQIAAGLRRASPTS